MISRGILGGDGDRPELAEAHGTTVAALINIFVSYNKMLLVVAAITFKFYRKFYCKFYCTYDRSIS